MKVATVNIRNTPDLSRAKVRKCARSIRTNGVAIAGLQEIVEDQDVADVLAGLGIHYDMINQSTHEPIIFDTKVLRLADSMECPPGFQNRGVLRFHPGYKNIPTPFHNGTWGIFKHVQAPEIPPFVFFNGHFINKAWNGRERNPEKLAERKDLWWEGYDTSQWAINNFRKAGLTVVRCGDYNRSLKAMPLFNPHEVPVAVHRIDGIYISKGRGRKVADFTVGTHEIVNNPSDHDMVIGSVTFK
jgi:hypothetical protein